MALHSERLAGERTKLVLSGSGECLGWHQMCSFSVLVFPFPPFNRACFITTSMSNFSPVREQRYGGLASKVHKRVCWEFSEAQAQELIGGIFLATTEPWSTALWRARARWCGWLPPALRWIPSLNHVHVLKVISVPWDLNRVVSLVSKAGQDLPHPCVLLATKGGGSGEGLPHPYEAKKPFLSQLVSKRGSWFTLKIKKERKWLASRVSLIPISCEWIINFFLLTFILFSSITLVLILKKKKRRRRKDFFPFVVWIGKNLIIKTVFSLSFFFCMCNYSANDIFKLFPGALVNFTEKLNSAKKKSRIRSSGLVGVISAPSSISAWGTPKSASWGLTRSPERLEDRR